LKKSDICIYEQVEDSSQSSCQSRDTIIKLENAVNVESSVDGTVTHLFKRKRKREKERKREGRKERKKEYTNSKHLHLN